MYFYLLCIKYNCYIFWTTHGKQLFEVKAKKRETRVVNLFNIFSFNFDTSPIRFFSTMIMLTTNKRLSCWITFMFICFGNWINTLL
ncbi:hypothetical protein Mgra_00006618, partial [Meloidogyne graminicola]